MRRRSSSRRRRRRTRGAYVSTVSRPKSLPAILFVVREGVVSYHLIINRMETVGGRMCMCV